MIDIILESVKLLQAIFSFIFVLFIPGFALSYCLFPWRAVDGVERFLISTVLSVTISSLLAFIFTRLTLGLDPYNFSICLLSITVVFTMVALWRSSKISSKISLLAMMQGLRTRLSTQSIVYTPMLIVGIVVIIILSNVTIAHTNDHFISPKTEFYIQPQYIEKVVEGRREGTDSVIIPLEIANNDTQQQTYRIEVRVDSVLVEQITAQIVNSADVMQTEISIPLMTKLGSSLIEIELYSENVPSRLIAQLRLWL